MTNSILAFDSSTETLSIAVRRGDAVFEFVGAGGQQASSRLIPEIGALMAKANLSYTELDGIAFGAGPGAFTGLRAACAVAQGLGFAVGVPLLPINTLHAVALQRFRADPSLHEITAALDARMGEVYWQIFDFSHSVLGAPLKGSEPQLSKADLMDFKLDVLPTARTLLDLGIEMLNAGLAVKAADAHPLYVRNKVAQTTDERMAERMVDRV